LASNPRSTTDTKLHSDKVNDAIARLPPPELTGVKRRAYKTAIKPSANSATERAHRTPRLTCVGLVSPGEDCGPELRSEEASITATALSLAFTQSLRRGEIGLVPSVRRMRMRSMQTGATTSRRRQAEKVVYGIGVGLEGQVNLLSRPAIAIHFSANAASHTWFEQELVADGYTPFEDGAKLQWFEVGLTADLGKRIPAP
jgi:hypothetical protein